MLGGATCSSLAPSIIHGTQRIVVASDLPENGARSLCAWSSNGLVAFALCLHENQHTVFVLDAQTMQVVQTLSGHSSPVSALAWIPQKQSQFDQNSVSLAVADSGGTLALWDIVEGCVQRTLHLPNRERAQSMIFIGGTIVSSGGEGNQQQRQMPLSQATMLATNGSPDASCLLVACESGALYVMDAELRTPDCLPFPQRSSGVAVGGARASETTPHYLPVGNAPATRGSSEGSKLSTAAGGNTNTKSNSKVEETFGFPSPSAPPLTIIKSRLADVGAIVTENTIQVFKGLDGGASSAALQTEIVAGGECGNVGGGGGPDPRGPSSSRLELDSLYAERFVDACFSASNSEVLFVVSPTTVVVVDWVLGLVLNSQLLSLARAGGVGLGSLGFGYGGGAVTTAMFQNIFSSFPSDIFAGDVGSTRSERCARRSNLEGNFEEYILRDDNNENEGDVDSSQSSSSSSSPHTSEASASSCNEGSYDGHGSEDDLYSGSDDSSGWDTDNEDEEEGHCHYAGGCGGGGGRQQSVLPILYSYTTDMKLTAWFVCDLDSVKVHSVDVRGGRLATRHVLTATQSISDPARFIVVFTDGSAAHWRFSIALHSWYLCAFYEATLYRPTAVAAVTPHTLCIALDSGALVVYDAINNKPLKRAHVVKAGSTKITALAALSAFSPSPAIQFPHIIGCGGGAGSVGQVLLGTTRTDRNGSVFQVSIVNLDTMAIVSTLRRGAPSVRKTAKEMAAAAAVVGGLGASIGGGGAAADVSPFKRMDLDASEKYLLISFENNTFEIWNIQTESLIHIHSTAIGGGSGGGGSGGSGGNNTSGGGLGRAFWALPASSLCRVRRSYLENANLKDNPQQLVGISTGEGVYYYLPAGDKLLRVPELFGIRLSSLSASPVVCSGCGNSLIALDSTPGGTVTHGLGLSESQWGVLTGMPKRVAVQLVICPAACRAQYTAQRNGRQTSSSPSKNKTSSSSSSSLTSSFIMGLATAANTLAGPIGGAGGGGGVKGGNLDLSNGSSLIAIVFEDGTFGVWDLSTRNKVGYSGGGGGSSSSQQGGGISLAAGIFATQCAWLEHEHLAVLTTRGDVVIASTKCDTLNAHVYSRSLASPIASPAFLFVTHGFNLKSSLELQPIERAIDSFCEHQRLSLKTEEEERAGASEGRTCKNATDAKEITDTSRTQTSKAVPQSTASASYIVRNVPPTRRVPFRNAFGQLVTKPNAYRTMTLEEELAMHVRFMPPPWLRERLVAASSAVDHLLGLGERRGGGKLIMFATSSGDAAPAAALGSIVAAVGYYVSQYMGYGTRQEFWDLASRCRGGWDRTADTNATLSFDETMRSNGRSPSRQTKGRFTAGDVKGVQRAGSQEVGEGRSQVGFCVDVVDVLCPAPFACPSRLSEAIADTDDLRRNRGALCIQRMHALHQLPLRGIDDSNARLHVARDLINMSELEKAGELLLETSFDSPHFPAHAQLSINVAAACQPHPLPTPFVLACKRAGAMLLARGDVEGAVEKFALIGEYHEACMALQAMGRWLEAATLARVSPSSSLSVGCKLELLRRWVKHRAQQGEVMGPALLLLRLDSPRAALALINESPHAADIGGFFGLYLMLSGLLPMQEAEALDATVVSPSHPDDYHSPTVGAKPAGAATMRAVLASVLGDYISLLESTSNVLFARKLKQMRSCLEPAS